MLILGQRSRSIAGQKELSRTDCLVLEIFRAILEERLGKRIYFTQTDIEQYRVLGEPGILRVSIRALFTGIADPERYGREGIFPIYPNAWGIIDLVNHEVQVMYWQIHAVHLALLNVDGPIHNIQAGFPVFDEKDLEKVLVSDTVHGIASRLLRRGPAITRVMTRS